ncbi:MAG: bleomycin resistance protein [Senegalia sp. (in: firmicutes)]|uniref:bleomycin resistance protein n=1 Tax=Senegalia sp. (in: firmicutes) TaxID=1924098 RepID=UPI003F9C5079
MQLNSLVPEISVFDINVSKDFYINILGFKLEYERIEDKFAFLSYGKAQLMIEEIHESGWNTSNLEYPLGRGINFEIECEDTEKLISKLKENNISLFRDLKITKYRKDLEVIEAKEFLVEDPNGYLLRFAQ